MDDALFVSLFEGFGNLSSNLEGLVDGDRASRQSFRKILAINQLQNEEGFAVSLLQTVDRGDVLMVQRSKEVCLAPEAGETF